MAIHKLENNCLWWRHRSTVACRGVRDTDSSSHGKHSVLAEVLWEKALYLDRIMVVQRWSPFPKLPTHPDEDHSSRIAHLNSYLL